VLCTIQIESLYSMCDLDDGKPNFRSLNAPLIGKGGLAGGIWIDGDDLKVVYGGAWFLGRPYGTCAMCAAVLSTNYVE